MKKIINKNNIFYFLTLFFFKSTFANENINQFQVEADKSIEYFEKQKIYVASGNAIASKGNFSLKAEKIKAFIDETNRSNISNIEATGNVIINRQNIVAKSDFAKYDFNKKFILLKGNVQSIKSKKFKLKSKKFISFDDINKVAESEGDVRLFLSGPLTISSKRISANFDKNNNTLISASAKGNVKIQTKAETITCNSAKYNNKTDIILLKGNVTIKRNNSVLNGEKGYMNLKTRKSKIESGKSQRVKGIFKPAKK